VDPGWGRGSCAGARWVTDPFRLVERPSTSSEEGRRVTDPDEQILLKGLLASINDDRIFLIPSSISIRSPARRRRSAGALT
jgi:hypothetical protein